MWWNWRAQGRCVRGVGAHARPGFHDQLVSLCLAAGFAPRVAQEARRLETVVALVAGGFGAALLPASLAREPRGDVFRPIAVEAPDALRLDLLLAWRAGDASPIRDSLIAALREARPWAKPTPHSGHGDIRRVSLAHELNILRMAASAALSTGYQEDRHAIPPPGPVGPNCPRCPTAAGSRSAPRWTTAPRATAWLAPMTTASISSTAPRSISAARPSACWAAPSRRWAGRATAIACRARRCTAPPTIMRREAGRAGSRA